MYYKEPCYEHSNGSRSGVLLVNLGTPVSLTPSAIRSYLKFFLFDRRVVNLPTILRYLILYIFILPIRPYLSLRKYKAIWLDHNESPLSFYTRRQTELLRERLFGQALVEYAMCYSPPYISQAIQQLRAQQVDRILVIPLYPQYSSSTTGAVYDQIGKFWQKAYYVPDIRVLHHFYDHSLYIQLLAQHVRNQLPPSTHLVISFHGTPQKNMMQGDPYSCLCHKTVRLLAESLGLKEGEYTLSFQSRFGRGQWLQPNTENVLIDLAKKNENVAVICPGFVADCLETLEEINMAGRNLFLRHTKVASFTYISCFNDQLEFIDMLALIIQEKIVGW